MRMCKNTHVYSAISFKGVCVWNVPVCVSVRLFKGTYVSDGFQGAELMCDRNKHPRVCVWYEHSRVCVYVTRIFKALRMCVCVCVCCECSRRWVCAVHAQSWMMWMFRGVRHDVQGVCERPLSSGAGRAEEQRYSLWTLWTQEEIGPCVFPGDRCVTETLHSKWLKWWCSEKAVCKKRL